MAEHYEPLFTRGNSCAFAAEESEKLWKRWVSEIIPRLGKNMLVRYYMKLIVHLNGDDILYYVLNILCSYFTALCDLKTFHSAHFFFLSVEATFQPFSSRTSTQEKTVVKWTTISP